MIILLHYIGTKKYFLSGVKDDEFHQVIQEAQDVLKDVRGTTEAIEDAKLFKMLCQQVRSQY